MLCASSLSFSGLSCPSSALRRDRLRWPVCGWFLFFSSLPLFRVPRFFLCIARLTSFEADLEYLRAMVASLIELSFQRFICGSVSPVARVIRPQQRVQALREAHERT